MHEVSVTTWNLDGAGHRGLARDENGGVTWPASNCLSNCEEIEALYKLARVSYVETVYRTSDKAMAIRITSGFSTHFHHADTYTAIT